MALLQTHFFSESLGLSTSMNVLLPQPTSASQVGLPGASKKTSYPVLYLLHGWSDDESIWMRRTSIERYAAPLGLVIVMPRVDLSYYQNTAAGMNYWTFVSEELPHLCESWFPISTRRDETFVAGLSMGGYGALRLALTHPERYGAVASLSGVTDIHYAATRLPADDASRALKMRAIFGDAPLSSGADLFHLAAHIPAARRPRLYQCCGTGDFLYADNIRFRDHLHQLGWAATYNERPGSHEWGFWDRSIQDVLAWLLPARTHTS